MRTWFGLGRNGEMTIMTFNILKEVLLANEINKAIILEIPYLQEIHFYLPLPITSELLEALQEVRIPGVLFVFRALPWWRIFSRGIIFKEG